MRDITKCNNMDCINRHRCHRWLSEPLRENQSYAFWQVDKRGRCFGFWNIKWLGIKKIKK